MWSRAGAAELTQCAHCQVSCPHPAYSLSPSRSHPQYIHEHKTAALLEAAVVSGAILGGASQVRHITI